MGIVTINQAGAIVMVNQFALRQFGYAREELLGQPIEILIPGQLRKRHVGHRDGYHASDQIHRPMGVGMDLSALRKNGSEFPVEVSLSSYTTGKGKFSIAFISDISIRKASENALLRLNDELERKVDERTQSLRDALNREKELGELKSRFVSMASHEFRTPLSTILSSAYLVSKYPEAEDQPKRDKHIQRIVSAVNMLTDILNDFLSVGKIEEGRIQVRPIILDLPEWMLSIINELEPVLKPRQHFNFRHEGVAEVSMDPSMLKHIVQNLVSNAIKFSPEGSNIDINTHCQDETVILSVKDKGIGISKADQKHLFERFFRGTNAVHIQGTGLGLHIVEKYARFMNGKVSYTSDIGKGTSFIITFTQEKLIP